MPLTGTVGTHSPASTISQTGGVSYNVRLDIESNRCTFVGGHERHCDIIADKRENVLLIRTGPSNSTSPAAPSSSAWPVDKLERVEVKLGLRRRSDQ